MSIRDYVDHFRVRHGYWFAPKMFGLGATPVTWQGWLITIAFTAALIADVRLVPGNVAKIAIGLALLIVFIVITIGKTDGGWRWRWGADD